MGDDWIDITTLDSPYEVQISQDGSRKRWRWRSSLPKSEIGSGEDWHYGPPPGEMPGSDSYDQPQVRKWHE